MFLGFTKRRQEAVSELHQGTSSRPVLEHYSLPFLDQMVSLVTTGTVISYAIYTVNSPLIGSQMMLTIPPVVYGIFRYLYLIYDRSDDRSTSAMVAGDKGMHRRRRRLRGRSPSCCSTSSTRAQAPRPTPGRRARLPSRRSGRGRSPRRWPGRRRRGGRRSSKVAVVPIDITRRCSWPAGIPGGRPVSNSAARPSPSSLPSGSWTLTTSSWWVLVSSQPTSRPRRDVEAPLVGQLGQAQDVPAAADHVELAVDRLAVVGEEQEADAPSSAPSRRRRQVGEQLGLAAALELEVDRLVLAVGAEEPQVHRQPAAGADLLLDDLAGEDDLAGARPRSRAPSLCSTPLMKTAKGGSAPAGSLTRRPAA